ncbi:MAG: hypothetical protein U0228_27545 [Myxococcaceae bacterium]
MTSLSTLQSRPESTHPVPVVAHLDSLPLPIRRALRSVFAQLLAGERCALVAAQRATTLETDPTAQAFAARQARDEARHVAFFERSLTQLGATDLDADVSDLLGRASAPADLPRLLVGINLVIETLGHSIFDAATTDLRRLAGTGLFSTRSTETLEALADSTERLQRDESQHLAFGILRLRDERRRLDDRGRAELDDDVRAWHAELRRFFGSMTLVSALAGLHSFRPGEVLAHFEARARVVGVSL